MRRRNGIEVEEKKKEGGKMRRKGQT